MVRNSVRFAADEIIETHGNALAIERIINSDNAYQTLTVHRLSVVERRRKAAAAAAAEAEEKRRAAEMTEVEAEQHGDGKEAVQPAATEGAIDTAETVLPFAQEPIGEKVAALADQNRQSEQAERRMKDEVAEADRQMEEKVNISAARRLASLIARKLPLRQNLALAACWLCFVLPTIY